MIIESRARPWDKTGAKNSISWRTHHSETVFTIRRRHGLRIALILNRNVIAGATMLSRYRSNLCLAAIPEVWLLLEMWLFPEILLASGSRTRILIVVLGRSACKIAITPYGVVHEFTSVGNEVIPRPLTQIDTLGRIEISQWLILNRKLLPYVTNRSSFA